MQRQQPCDRGAACAALEFAIPSPPTPDSDGGIRSSFNPHLTAQPAPAEGSPPQVLLTGLRSGEVDLWFADTELSPFSVVPQFGIAFPFRVQTRHAPRQAKSFNPAGSLSRFGQAYSLRFTPLPEPSPARWRFPLAVERRLCGAVQH